jgi:hypothetical protein
MIEDKLVFEHIYDHFPKVVISPLNPLTVDNPNLLVFNGRALLGIYFPTKAELKKPDDLLRRLFVSKLAMAAQIRTVLVLEGNKENVVLGNTFAVANAFDSVYILENVDDFIKYMNDDIRQRTPIHKSIRIANINRFWATLSYVERLHRTEKPTIPKEFQYNSFYGEVRSWCNPELKRVKSAFLAGETLVTFKRKSKQTFRSDFDSLMTFLMMFNYALDNGQLIPEKNHSRVFRYLGTDNIDYLFSNEVYLRSLVFLGLVPSTLYEPNDIESLGMDYMNYLNNSKIRL